MFYRVFHFCSKYSLSLLFYSLLVATSFTFIENNLLTLTAVSIIYFLILKFKIISFDSCWLDRK